MAESPSSRFNKREIALGADKGLQVRCTHPHLARCFG
jgi:hypothetical protein